MSNKRNRYKRQNYQAKRAVAEKETSGLFPSELFANDRFTNPMAFIGGASKLMNAGTYERSCLTNNIEKLTVMYRQNWICKRIIDVPSEDMTRAWYTLNSQITDDKQAELHRLQRHHDIKGQITNAIRWARLYGGSAALIVVAGQQDMLDEPLDLNLLQPDCFRGLIVVDRWMGLDPSTQIEQDMDDVDFGYPKYYNIYLDDMKLECSRVHHSRLITFRGRDLPHSQQVSQSYWGASQMEHIYEEMQKRDTTSANIAQLVFQANIRTLKMSDFGEILAMGTQSQKNKVFESIQQQNRLMSNFGLQVLSSEDSFENHPYSFSGLADLYEKFMSDMAGAAEIPATKLYGRSPDGMNATGQSDMTMYYETISKLQQKHLRPALQRLIPIMCISIWGCVPDDYEIKFNPIATTSPADQASIGSQVTKNVIDAFGAGLIGRKTALLQLRQNGSKLGIWTKITDEMIEQANDDVEQGGQQGGDPNADPNADPMQAMMAQMGGGQPPAEGQGEGQAPAQGQAPAEAKVPEKGQKPKEEQKAKETPTGSKEEAPKAEQKAEKPKESEKEVNEMDKKVLEQLVSLIAQEYGNKKSQQPRVQPKEQTKEQPKKVESENQYQKSEQMDMKTLAQLAQLIKAEYANKKQKSTEGTNKQQKKEPEVVREEPIINKSPTENLNQSEEADELENYDAKNDVSENDDSDVEASQGQDFDAEEPEDDDAEQMNIVVKPDFTDEQLDKLEQQAVNDRALSDEAETEQLARQLIELVNEHYGKEQYEQQAKIRSLANAVNEQYGAMHPVEEEQKSVKVHDKKVGFFRKLFGKKR